MIFLLYTKMFLPPLPYSPLNHCTFSHFSDLSTGSSILWTGRLIYPVRQKTHFPHGHIPHEIRGKGTKGEKEITGSVFWMFCLLSTRTIWFPFRRTTPACSPISDDIKCMYDTLLTPHKARNIIPPMTKTKKASRGRNTWKPKPKLN